MAKLYAEDLPYFQTGKSAADTWLEKVETEIKRAGGKVRSSGYVSDAVRGSAYMVQFDLEDMTFRVVERVLESKTKNDKAAKIQAATTMYHDIKARMVTARRKGARVAFLAELLLPSGQTVGEIEHGSFLDLVAGNDSPLLLTG